MSFLTFLGTGGGRFVTQSQVRYTGGLWLEVDIAARSPQSAVCNPGTADRKPKTLLIDPGVGTLIRALEFKRELKTLDAILVSHNHLDHYNDAEACLEGMTREMNKKRGTLFVNENVSRYISDYHKAMVDFRTFDSPGKHTIEGVKVETIPTYDHSGGFGFKFHLKDGIITYASDTNYNKKLAVHYKNSDILILNVLRPDDCKIFKHLCVGEAEALIRESRPKRAILSHFGRLLAEGDAADKVAKRITKDTGVDTVAAKDGMRVEL